MKKIIALVLCTISICALLCSCNYQDAVDSVRTELMNTSKDLLDPFFKESTESTANSEEAGGETDESAEDNTTSSVVIDVSSMF